jgi:hypothetical protein
MILDMWRAPALELCAINDNHLSSQAVCDTVNLPFIYGEQGIQTAGCKSRFKLDRSIKKLVSYDSEIDGWEEL